MARVKLSPLLTDISGSIGSLTLQRNKYGMSLRKKPIPIKSFSPAQQTIRQYVSTVQRAWQELTDAERLQWDRFLDFSGQTINNDNSIKLSGHALFLKYQLMRLICGYPLLTTIEYKPLASYPNFSEFNFAANTLNIVFDASIDATEVMFMLKVTTPRVPGRSFSRRGLRQMFCSFTSTDTFNIYSPYNAAFGIPPAVGDTLHYSLRWFSSDAPIVAGLITGTSEIQSP